MKRVCLVILFFLFMSAFFPLVHADRGMISVTSGVSVYEPGQKAILAWNGYEEILILSTDVMSSQETQVLEIMPLPSKPEIEEASFHSFERIQEMVWEEGVNQLMYTTEDNARSASVEVLFHTQIGAHNVTVVTANTGSGLVDWANSFLSTSGISQEISLQNFETVIGDYMRRGFRYYVLDLVSFSPDEKSINPILYRFNSSTLYYPLLITSPVGGEGEITLFILANEKVEKDYWPMQPGYFRRYGEPWRQIQFMLSRGDLSKIDLRIGEILPDGAWLSVLTFKGDLSLLNGDMMISEEAFTSDADLPPTIVVTFSYTLVTLCFALGVASALAGIVVWALLLRVRDKR